MSIRLGYTNYAASASVTQRLVDEYRASVVESLVDCGSGNILVTGRANSGVEGFQDTLNSYLATTENSVVFDLDKGDSVEEARALVSNPDYTVVVKDLAGVFFANSLPLFPTNLIYFTRHMTLRENKETYSLFDHHIAFATTRNQDISEYPSPFCVVGTELQRGEYVSVDTGQLSTIDITRLAKAQKAGSLVA